MLRQLHILSLSRVREIPAKLDLPLTYGTRFDRAIDYTGDFALQVDPIRSVRCDAICNAITRSRGRVPKDAETRALLSGRQPATNCGSSAITS